jgi:hypothetical protein
MSRMAEMMASMQASLARFTVQESTTGDLVQQGQNRPFHTPPLANSSLSPIPEEHPPMAPEPQIHHLFLPTLANSHQTNCLSPDSN